MDDWLGEAVRQRAFETGDGYDPATDPGDFREMYQDIVTAANSWFFNSIRIVDIGNWRFKNLISMDGQTIRIKKPQLLLSVEINARGDMSLSWYPVSVNQSADYRELEEGRRMREGNPEFYEYRFGDWLVWDCQNQPGADQRQNSIIRIRHFAKLIAAEPETKGLPRSEQYLLKAVKGLLENIFCYLEQLVDVEVQDVLVVEETAAGLIGRIRSQQEARAVPSVFTVKNKKNPPRQRVLKKPVPGRSAARR